MSSIVGRYGQRYTAFYSTSKWALQGLMKSLALELDEMGITVNCVAPGPVDTPFYARGRPEGEARRAAGEGAVLPVSLLAPEDIARAVAYLAGPGGAWVSGATIDVDGGRAAPKIT